MSSCINNSGNGNSGISQVERYFDDEGRLLPEYYPFIYDQTADAAKRHKKDLSWLRPDEPLDRRRAAAKAKGWEIGGSY